MKEAVFFVTGWYMPYFHLLLFVIIKQYGEGDMSQFVIFVLVLSFLYILVVYLLFIFWKPVNHNQPLFRLAPSCFFPHALIIHTLLNSLHFGSLRLDSQKGFINSVLTHYIKTFMVKMAVDQIGCVAHSKIVFFRIFNNIEFI